jgi:hypothetical protein
VLTFPLTHHDPGMIAEYAGVAPRVSVKASSWHQAVPSHSMSRIGRAVICHITTSPRSAEVREKQISCVLPGVTGIFYRLLLAFLEEKSRATIKGQTNQKALHCSVVWAP